MSTPESTWSKSSYSGSSGDNCVEVAVLPEMIHVRDSKDVRTQALVVSPTAWSRFTAHTAGNRG
ncbi:DUF397 domain-containing protein [Embleya sp. NPDC050154]|uniref:DUF397 domain-containing protein n=1 Tax=unclassified Embleya TaxID=2699296 RepID=UPI0037A84E69